MSAIIILNVVFAAAVIIGIVGMLARSIQADNVDTAPQPVRSAPRHRRSTARAQTARAQVLGRTADTRV